MSHNKPWTESQMDTIIGNLLRGGVMLAAATVLCGAVFYLLREGGLPANYQVFRGEPLEWRAVGGIFHSAISLRGRGIIQLGLLLLIATPVARVAFSLFAFAAARDRMYALFTAIVLAILLYSLFGSGALF